MTSQQRSEKKVVRPFQVTIQSPTTLRRKTSSRPLSKSMARSIYWSMLGFGHPLGATGIGQTHEIYLQLRGEPGERQVRGAKIGLCQTMSNTGSESHVLIFGNEKVC